LALTFGQLRPVHVNDVIMGAFSSLFIVECYYSWCRACAAGCVQSLGRNFLLGLEIKAIGSRRCANAAAQFLERPHLVP
jgi:cbb3-type cytochrome oxidase subunit 1